MSILTLNNVSYKYKGANKAVLTDVKATFEMGKLYAIMGKSGAGKSTMLSLVSGLDVPTKGTIYYNGTDLLEINRDAYRAKNIGVIFQGYNLLTNMTALENIILSMNISGIKAKEKKHMAYEFLQKTGIDRETANRKILKLSGGEQQRVGIARAISHNPDIIIADEPTGNLDAETGAKIIEIFCNLARNHKKCVIIVTHSRKVASHADEIWGLNGGNMTFVK